MTSHAAVVARGMGKCCVVGLRRAARRLRARARSGVGDVVVRAGDADHARRRDRRGDARRGSPTVTPELGGAFAELMRWADRVRRLARAHQRRHAARRRDRARSSAPRASASAAPSTCSSSPARILAVREMILAGDARRRARARSTKLLPDAARRLRRDLPRDGGAARSRSACSIRRSTSSCRTATSEIARGRGGARHATSAAVRAKIDALHEFNPMLGHRGCRLGITYPEIYRMQVRAIVEARAARWPRRARAIQPEIMIPLVSHVRGARAPARARATRRSRAVLRASTRVRVPSTIGTMIEVPRAALTADRDRRATPTSSRSAPTTSRR